ncbi:hypothetical protein GUITHDRAFT_111120 [Guillardia theta CCMP2712]|uniref:Uncharacterized protein n=1 Tax=Guillardia theta (strain CCMP2712) TaxID=905079 RepID=L1J3T1_GUITC|nr:hypothetical protein GUITHDRAFT_111120 [Guillardia theta CCMP2712]EKX42750.1 hypothetical protein GUITHDRAFT_111120 [Guillardia theta CCMP2712]|eukprot:XP_005829730.1 hypothetical protein GUITHDRAFT_111120 [Guillardia theta CCMP2712]
MQGRRRARARARAEARGRTQRLGKALEAWAAVGEAGRARGRAVEGLLRAREAEGEAEREGRQEEAFRDWKGAWAASRERRRQAERRGARQALGLMRGGWEGLAAGLADREERSKRGERLREVLGGRRLGGYIRAWRLRRRAKAEEMRLGRQLGDRRGRRERRAHFEAWQGWAKERNDDGKAAPHRQVRSLMQAQLEAWAERVVWKQRTGRETRQREARRGEGARRRAWTGWKDECASKAEGRRILARLARRQEEAEARRLVRAWQEGSMQGRRRARARARAEARGRTQRLGKALEAWAAVGEAGRARGRAVEGLLRVREAEGEAERDGRQEGRCFRKVLIPRSSHLARLCFSHAVRRDALRSSPVPALLPLFRSAGRSADLLKGSSSSASNDVNLTLQVFLLCDSFAGQMESLLSQLKTNWIQTHHNVNKSLGPGGVLPVPSFDFGFLVNRSASLMCIEETFDLPLGSVDLADEQSFQLFHLTSRLLRELHETSSRVESDLDELRERLESRRTRESQLRQQQEQSREVKLQEEVNRLTREVARAQLRIVRIESLKFNLTPSSSYASKTPAECLHRISQLESYRDQLEDECLRYKQENDAQAERLSDQMRENFVLRGKLSLHARLYSSHPLHEREEGATSSGGVAASACHGPSSGCSIEAARVPCLGCPKDVERRKPSDAAAAPSLARLRLFFSSRSCPRKFLRLHGATGSQVHPAPSLLALAITITDDDGHGTASTRLSDHFPHASAQYQREQRRRGRPAGLLLSGGIEEKESRLDGKAEGESLSRFAPDRLAVIDERMRDIGKNFSNMINQVPSSLSTALVSKPSVSLSSF